MKKLLLGALCLATTSLSAQDFTSPTARVKVKVIPSASAQFDINSLEVSGNGINQEEITWNAGTSTFEFTVPIWDAGYYEVVTPDRMIGFRSIIRTDGNWENLEPGEEILVHDTVDFRGYYYVNITPASNRYTLELDYLGKPRTSDDDISIGTERGIFTEQHNNATYLKPGYYECEALVWESETNIPVVVEPQYFTLGEQDLSYPFNAEIEKKHLVTFDIKDSENKPLPNADVYFTNVSDDIDIVTDTSGKAKVYMADGTYYYVPDLDNQTMFFDPSYISEITVAGSDVQTNYSFKDKGICKQEIIITGNQIKEARMDIYSAYINEDYDFIDEEVENNRTVFTFYAPKGKYCYNIEASDNYNHVNYYPAHGIINVTGNGSTEINFTNQGQKKVLFSADFPANTLDIYDENGMKVRSCGFAYESSGMSAAKATSDGEAEALLLPGKYTLIAEGSDYTSKIIYLYTKEIEVTENSGEMRIDFKESEMATAVLRCQPKNTPTEIIERLQGMLYNSKGIALDRVYYSTYNDSENYEYHLTPGDYTLQWEESISGDMSQTPVAFKYTENLTLKDGVTTNTSLDFNKLATTRIQIEHPENSVIYGVDLNRDGNSYYVDFIFDTSEDYFYLISEPGNFQVKAWGQERDRYDMNLFSQTVSFSQTQGQNNQTVNLKLEETGEDMSCIIVVNDIHAKSIRNATLTVNGKVMKADYCDRFYLGNIKDDVLNITLEAPGYAPLHFTKNVHQYERSIFNMMELCFFMNKTNESTDIQEVSGDAPVVVRTAADKFEVGGEFTSDCRYQIVDMQGITMANGTVNPSQNQITLGTLPSGIYVLILENGKNRQTIKFIK